jgi:cobalt-zinc-cadmium efflux system outer membrane protein
VNAPTKRAGERTEAMRVLVREACGKTHTRSFIALAFLLALAACAIHPAGEREERDRAAEIGKSFDDAGAPPPLPDKPTVQDYLQSAFYASADLRARYWDWRAALERIPQEASPPNPALNFSYLFNSDNLKAWDRTTLGLSNDPMNNLELPSKLATKGRRALEEARAAGLRFEAAKFRVQADVLSSYEDLALHGEWIRIQEERVELSEIAASEMGARVASGGATQSELVKAETELDLAQSDLADMHEQYPPLVAKMNALLGREPDAAVPMPSALPEPRPLPAADSDILRIAAERSPELAALEREVGARKEALELAKAARIPDFGLSFNFTGSMSQTLGGMVLLPLRREAIEGGIEEARALLRSAEAARTQYSRDLAASFVLDLYVLRNAERRIDLFEKTIVPRAEQAIALSQAAWSSGRGNRTSSIEMRRTLLDARLALAQLKSEREKALAAIETWSKLDVEALHPVRMGAGGP